MNAIKFLQNNPIARPIIYKACRRRAHGILASIERYLNKGEKILDLGAGSCNVHESLVEAGFDVTSVDVQNFSFVDGLEPLIYDGKTLPFENDQFDAALILTVLHHTPDPERIMREAMRVSRKIIIIEDIYKTTFQKYKTHFIDSLINLEFRGHPHSNKTDKEWLELFAKLGLKVLDNRGKNTYARLAQRVYHLSK